MDPTDLIWAVQFFGATLLTYFLTQKVLIKPGKITLLGRAIAFGCWAGIATKVTYNLAWINAGKIAFGTFCVFVAVLALAALASKK